MERETTMGCDIHSFAEVRKDGKWDVAGDVFPLDDWYVEHYKRTHSHEPFRDRNYSVFAFIAGVRNYSDVQPLAAPKGKPDDLSTIVEDAVENRDADGHSHSWLTLAELLNVDYDAPIEDRRITVQTGPNSFNGGATAKPGGGTSTTLREFLSQRFFDHLDVLKTLGDPEDVRVVFWFDN